MLYNVIKYSPISNNIASMNLEKKYIFSAAFSFVGLNNIEYFTTGISDGGISPLTITLSNILPASIMQYFGTFV